VAIIVLRHCYNIDRRAAGMLPAWERELLVNGGKQILGLDSGGEGQGEFTASEVAILTTPGLGA